MTTPEAPCRRRGARRAWRAALIAPALLTASGPGASAGPQDGVVQRGNATITETAGATTIDQSSARAIIDWRSFGIGAGESVRFRQPDGNAIALNRVTGNDRSDIQGSLSANGQVWLVNPNGIVFGPNAVVDVHGLVATTANIGDDRFMAGDYRFDQASPDRVASVVNEGTITLSDRGLAALVAPEVRNDGVIAGRFGTVVVAGAPTFAIDLQGDRLLSFAVTSQVTEAPADGSALVENDGRITMDGGTVLLTAEAAAGVVDGAINTSGVIQARGVATRDGAIVLVSDGSGDVVVDGTLDAGPAGAGGRAGTLYVAGRSVEFTDAASIADLGGVEVAAVESLTVDTALSAANDLSLTGRRIRIGADVSAGADARLRGVDIATTGDGVVRSRRLDVGSTATAAERPASRVDLRTETDVLAIGSARGAGQFASAAIDNTGDLHIGSVDSQGIQADSVVLQNNGVLTLEQPIRATGQGDAVIAVTGGFVNDAGADAVQAPNGRALVYSIDPTVDTRGGLGGEVVYGDIRNVPPGSIDVPGIVFIYERNPDATPSDPTPPPLTDEDVNQVTRPDVVPYLGSPEGQGKSPAIETTLIRLPPVVAAQEQSEDRDLLFANDGNRDLWGLSGGK